MTYTTSSNAPVQQLTPGKRASVALSIALLISAGTLGFLVNAQSLLAAPHAMRLDPIALAASNDYLSQEPAPTPGSVSVSFQDGVAPTSDYAGTTDTYLSENDPTVNYGYRTTLKLEGDEPPGSDKDAATLLRWDVSVIPPGSVVTEVIIGLTTDRTNDTYEVYELKRKWVEREATWDLYSAGNNWELAGAQGAEDRGTMVLGQLGPTALGSYTLTLNSTGVAVVQSWIDNPASNHGLIIASTSSTDGVRLYSSEVVTATYRPQLTVNYVRGGPTPTPTTIPVDPVMSFQDGIAPTSDYAGTTDTYLSENNPTTNYGRRSTLVLDGDDPAGSGKDLASLLRWDLRVIPQGRVVEQVTISLMTDRSKDTYEVYELKRDWVESEATWELYSTGNTWELFGAQGAQDRGTTVLGQVGPVTEGGSYDITLNSAGVAVVQSWIDNPASNYGLIIANTTATDGLYPYSSDVVTATYRPKLTINLLPLGPTPTPTVAPVYFSASFQDGLAPTDSYTGTADTQLSENNPAINYGRRSVLALGGDEPTGSDKDVATLLRWDVIEIPPGSVVSQVTITLTTDRTNNTYEVYQLMRDWVENEATWEVSSKGNNWEMAGAQGAQDRGTTVLGRVGPTAGGTHVITLNSAGVAVVQSWLDNPVNNHGLIIANTSSTDGLNLFSSEVVTATARPRLMVSYLPAAPATPTATPVPTAPPVPTATPVPIETAAPAGTPAPDLTPTPARTGSKPGCLSALLWVPVLLFAQIRKRTRRV